MKKIIIKTASLSVYLLLCIPVLAMAGGPGFSGSVNDGAGNCGVPIDGGLSILAAAGVGYGIKKFKARKVAAKTKK